MVIGRAESGDGEEILMLGLSYRNIQLLLDGKPMNLSRRSHGDGMPDGLMIRIVAGRTEAEIVEGMRKAGLVDEATMVHRQPGL